MGTYTIYSIIKYFYYLDNRSIKRLLYWIQHLDQYTMIFDLALATNRDSPHWQGHLLGHKLSCYHEIRINIIVALTRQDSDLEAFSHNPSDGSFGPLTDRSTGLLSQQLVNSRLTFPIMGEQSNAWRILP
uniref:Helitron_like_N domain-containing protein n=1 Tax=Heterorhabditis bacteriophora TaxID=37862 RepID=A0A1I7WKN5_HETBA